jgi:hypothetical protein
MLETRAATPARPPTRSTGVTEDLDFDWRPEPLERAVDSDRTFRWPIVIAALFIGVSAALIIRLFIAVPADTATARLEEYRQVATALDTALHAVLDAAPGSADAVRDLGTAIDEVRESVARPLPGGVPVIGGGPGAELDAAHQRLTTAVDAASALVGRLRISTDYRAAAAVILTLPMLPTEVEPDFIDPAARTLSEYQAGAVVAAAGLGPEPLLAEFRGQVDALLDEMPIWSDLYLLALRRGQADNAATMIGDLTARVEAARAELEAGLAELEAEIVGEAQSLIDGLRQAGLVVGS